MLHTDMWPNIMVSPIYHLNNPYLVTHLNKIMKSSFNPAINAYNQAVKTQKNFVKSLEQASKMGVNSVSMKLPAKSVDDVKISDLVLNQMQSTKDSIKQAELNAVKSVIGTIPTEQLATSITEAELALKKITAVRDRLVTAYQDIIKMPI